MIGQPDVDDSDIIRTFSISISARDNGIKCSTKLMRWASGAEDHAVRLDQYTTQLNGMRVIRLVKSDVKIAIDVDWFFIDGNAIQDGDEFIKERMLYSR
jgi:hypothetical protein